jgi:hypothetical protein
MEAKGSTVRYEFFSKFYSLDLAKEKIYGAHIHLHPDFKMFLKGCNLQERISGKVITGNSK